mmetsp:Transcript_8975/g.33104  ORF Transcript_8975/g.33104 Transcript_8975/m.33104 type:complete len:749 (-) Transcript_8975:2-2248(-)|eukprot:CAMPEP_0117435076 /NCGR_PEP_ID=MMETSP0759-20121206/287_1 /TAXON_ID=63605 /ORGANISM="Percolomonas cosmopolitus, Strain WS" /LENGTH=748 /DNA_ID=CAMNT_0005226597 /DNA_START=159 /DNA_END=2405 /DNA_ORIENTATION=+
MKRLSEYNPDPIVIKKRFSHANISHIDSSRLKEVREKLHYRQHATKYKNVESRFLEAKPGDSELSTVTTDEKRIKRKNASDHRREKRRNTHLGYQHHLNSRRDPNAEDIAPLNPHSSNRIRSHPEKFARESRRYHNPFSARDSPTDDDFIMSDSESMEPEHAEENDTPNMMTLTEPMRLKMPDMSEYDSFSPRFEHARSGEGNNLLSVQNDLMTDGRSSHFSNLSTEDPSALETNDVSPNGHIKSHKPRKSQPSVLSLSKQPPSIQSSLKSKPKPFRPKKLNPTSSHSTPYLETYDPTKLRTSLNLAPLQRQYPSGRSKRDAGRNNEMNKKKKRLKDAYSARDTSDARRPLSIAEMRKKKGPHGRRQLKRSPQTAPTKSRRLRLMNIKRDLEKQQQEKRFLMQKIQEQERQHHLNLQLAIADTREKSETQLQDFMDSYSLELRRDLQNLREKQPHLLMSGEEILDGVSTPSGSSAQDGFAAQKQQSNVLLIDIIHIPVALDRQMVRLLKHYQNSCINEISTHEGTLTNAMGNSIMAVFEDNQIQECMSCAVQIVTRLNEDLNANFVSTNSQAGDPLVSDNSAGFLPLLKSSTTAQKKGQKSVEPQQDKIHLGVTICRGRLQKISHTSFVGRVLQKTHLIGMHLPILKYKLIMDEDFHQQLRATLSPYASKCLNVGSVQVLSHPVRLFSLLDQNLYIDFLADDYSLNDGDSSRGHSSRSSPKRKFGFGGLGRIFKLSTTGEKRRHSTLA